MTETALIINAWEQAWMDLKCFLARRTEYLKERIFYQQQRGFKSYKLNSLLEEINQVDKKIRELEEKNNIAREE